MCVAGRGCGCAYHARRRVYARRYATKMRRAKLDARRRSARTCPRRFGKYGVCGAVLDSDVIGGHLVVSCSACDRMARGICRDCPRPVAGAVGKARRCAEHKVTARLESCRKHDANYKEQRRRSSRLNYQQNDARRRRKNEYKKAWRKANPEKVKAYKRAEVLRGNPKTLAYHVAYRAAHRRKRANVEAKRYRGELALRTCTTPRCQIVVTGRKKKCTRCKARDAQQAAALLALTAGRGFRSDLRATA